MNELQKNLRGILDEIQEVVANNAEDICGYGMNQVFGILRDLTDAIFDAGEYSKRATPGPKKKTTKKAAAKKEVAA